MLNRPLTIAQKLLCKCKLPKMHSVNRLHFIQGRRHGVGWGGHAHTTFSRGCSSDWRKSSEFSRGGGTWSVRFGVLTRHVQNTENEANVLLPLCIQKLQGFQLHLRPWPLSQDPLLALPQTPVIVCASTSYFWPVDAPFFTWFVFLFYQVFVYSLLQWNVWLWTFIHSLFVTHKAAHKANTIYKDEIQNTLNSAFTHWRQCACVHFLSAICDNKQELDKPTRGQSSHGLVNSRTSHLANNYFFKSRKYYYMYYFYY